MTIELVDGHGGKPHISGDDLGDFKAGILGDAGYVFKRADMLAATLNGANSLTVNTGSGVLPVSGRHFRITAPETVTVTSGTQGQNRNDLVVIRPSTSTDGTTVENAALVVLRGTPTSGTATDPATQDGDLPLYRLQLTGVSVAEPIALFDVMVPYNEFRDSISRSVRIWSGAWVMAANHTARFSETIENFKTLYFVWSSYTGGQIRDYNYNITAVPVAFVLNHLSVSTIHTMRDSADVNATKVLYVSKTYATGNAVNDQGDSKSFVLREVYGVA